MFASGVRSPGNHGSHPRTRRRGRGSRVRGRFRRQGRVVSRPTSTLPGQVVISGDMEGVAGGHGPGQRGRSQEDRSPDRFRGLPLPPDGPRPGGIAGEASGLKFSDPPFPVISNVTARTGHVRRPSSGSPGATAHLAGALERVRGSGWWHWARNASSSWVPGSVLSGSEQTERQGVPLRIPGDARGSRPTCWMSRSTEKAT